MDQQHGDSGMGIESRLVNTKGQHAHRMDGPCRQLDQHMQAAGPKHALVGRYETNSGKQGKTRLTDRQCDRLADRQCDRLADRQCDRLADRQWDRLADRQCDRLEADRQCDRLADRQWDKLADRQWDRLADRQKM